MPTSAPVLVGNNAGNLAWVAPPQMFSYLAWKRSMPWLCEEGFPAVQNATAGAQQQDAIRELVPTQYLCPAKLSFYTLHGTCLHVRSRDASSGRSIRVLRPLGPLGWRCRWLPCKLKILFPESLLALAKSLSFALVCHKLSWVDWVDSVHSVHCIGLISSLPPIQRTHFGSPARDL